MTPVDLNLLPAFDGPDTVRTTFTDLGTWETGIASDLSEDKSESSEGASVTPSYSREKFCNQAAIQGYYGCVSCKNTTGSYCIPCATNDTSPHFYSDKDLNEDKKDTTNVQRYERCHEG